MKFIDFLNIFDQELGAKARAFLVSVAGLATASVVVLQALLDVTTVLPQWKYVGAAASILTGLVTILGRFTTFGNKPPV